MRNLILLPLALFIAIFCSAASAQTPTSFSQAKRLLEKHIYPTQEYRETFYCGCSYSGEKQVDAASCGYTPRKNAKRGKRIEWEHVVPASRFGKTRACWTDGNSACVTKKGKAYKGRRCCSKVDPEFKRMEADLHNLVPAVGELNGDRSNYRMAVISGEERTYGACDFEIDSKNKLAEPMAATRGDIARIYFYMQSTYNMPLSDAEMEMFTGWMSKDPVSEDEQLRDARILEIQGNSNVLISVGF
ncbi:Nuclease NucM precursor [Pseudovibrio axinellae]|uniref:Nuclease NucM n=1 Tax=Pseudovibrio axinellae TaxID=989403 RepID=A0A166A0D4_9HYPH|nr:endonuclease [Pseudovibrio axinellae]KZL20485.1 Nuclease NucM precursor [Pseudovibrio axinellae]SEQ37124.1 deoxyribonuclease-1 [Pseudovibrio axinellae]